jgi:lipopolysaccharide biosynthesis glycosyltransferase
MGKNFWLLSKGRLTQVAFYRLLLPIFVDINRILHLDLDTIILKDLCEIYHEDFNENYILGILDYFRHGDKKYYDLINITNKKYLLHHDQTALNYALYPKIGLIPNKYVFFNFHDKLDIELYVKRLRQKIDSKELEKLYTDPTIIHFCLCYPKVWSSRTKYLKKFTQCVKRNNCKCKQDSYLWYSYAIKTDYYEEIYNYYKRKRYRKLH